MPYGASSEDPASSGSAFTGGAAAGAPVPPAQPAYAAGAAYAAQQPGGYAYPAGYAVPQQPRKNHGWIIALVVLGLLGLLAIFVASCTASLASMRGAQPAAFARNTVAVITMDGTMDYDGSVNSPEGLKYLLDQASDDSNVKAVVLRVNSGGGVAAAGEEMSTYLKDFDKPVVVSSAAINASAAYMISSQADYIYVLNSTDIGAIGTILQHYDLSELLDKLGINIENVKSADSKDSSYFNRPLTDEERERYQRLVDQINEMFVTTVAEGRGMKVEEVRKLADGMTWVGQDAVDVGIADAVGTFEDACEKAAELGGCAGDYNVDDLYISTTDFSQLMGLLGSGSNGSDSATLQAIKELIEDDGTVK